MRKKGLLLSLWLIGSSLAGATGGWADCTISVSAGASSFSVGTNITLTATPSGCQAITQVAFYNGTNLIGISSQAPFTVQWNTTGLPAQAYNVTAAAAFIGNGGGGSETTIDMVGDPASGPNLALNPVFGEGTSGGSWIEGDNQMCMSTWPYNGSSATGSPDGSCMSTAPATEDRMDDAIHTLSDFVKFANTLLSKNVGTLSSTFSSWFDQADQWVNPTTGRLEPLVAGLEAVSPVITNWLNQTYTNANAWCLPAESTLLNGNSSTAEDTYINAYSGTTTWGDLPHVLSCLNYNASSAVNNYQSCLTALTSAVCPAQLPAVCAANILGRSLSGPAPVYDGCTKTYEAWVNNSLILATGQAPKFALRAQFLNDVYSRAQTMLTVANQTAPELQAFISGPGAQLEAASSQTQPTVVLPNSVIYGWVDNPPSGGSGGCTSVDSKGHVTRGGCAHIVKVTAYAPGRNSNNYILSSGLPGPNPAPQGGGASALPWVQTTTSGWLASTRYYTLVQRDGYVYVSVRRWDEDHSPILFPNSHNLWQMLFHNAGSATTSGKGLPASCQGVGLSNVGGAQIGFGLESATVTGLGFVMSQSGSPYATLDQQSLANAFMLNDEGNGTVDQYASGSAGYASCLNEANILLTNGIESHACAEYIAASPKSNPGSVQAGVSGNGDSDYSLKFVDCSTLENNGALPPDDLTGSNLG